MAEDEIIVLKAVFCDEGEFELLSNTASQHSVATFRITVKCDQHTDGDCLTAKDAASNLETGENNKDPVTIDITFTLPSSYPETMPDISLATNSLTREACQKLRTDLLNFAGTLEAEPMVLMMIDWMKDHWKDYAQQMVKSCDGNITSRESEEIIVAVLHIDHMRSKVKYTKTLVKWAEDLQLGGRLMFYNHLILVLLEGLTTEVKEFIVRLRTQRVDVDSAGRSCKERMMRVLVEQPHPSSCKRYTSFEVVDCTSVSALEAVFKTSELSNVYRTELVPEFKLLH
ncbi:RWD domain-containing protein 3-like [Amphiura filiformis]|uniref:RWD domain-containing protein 3-like n=1 Tax=Amphiura filiformis TaxID=82378 RepID=UPI003B228A42